MARTYQSVILNANWNYQGVPGSALAYPDQAAECISSPARTSEPGSEKHLVIYAAKSEEIPAGHAIEDRQLGQPLGMANGFFRVRDRLFYLGH